MMLDFKEATIFVALHEAQHSFYLLRRSIVQDTAEASGSDDYVIRCLE